MPGYDNPKQAAEFLEKQLLLLNSIARENCELLHKSFFEKIANDMKENKIPSFSHAEMMSLVVLTGTLFANGIIHCFFNQNQDKLPHLTLENIEKETLNVFKQYNEQFKEKFNLRKKSNASAH